MERISVKAGGRPFLLPLVYIATISLIAVTGAALALLGSEHVKATAIRAMAEGDTAAIGRFIASNLTTADIDGSVTSSTRRSELDRELVALAGAPGYRAATVALESGAVLIGDAIDPTAEALLSRGAPPGQSTALLATDPSGAPILLERVPITVGSTTLVVTLERDASGVIESADETLRDLVLVTGVAALVLAVVLRMIFNAANVRLRQQQVAIAESRRRDPLTGLINHGAVVEQLTEVLAKSRAEGASIGIALVDIDNFRLLNETYGSPAGDAALQIAARALEAESEAWLGLGRYGPDEFLAIAPAAVARDLPATMRRVHTALEEASLQFEDSERLPLTLSVGVTYFPFHAAGVNELISAATSRSERPKRVVATGR